jgi:ABC-type antimicrobial peptide transport system permease subunit
MAAQLSAVLLPVRVATILFGALGGVGFALAIAGLYGIVSYTATRRRFEIGVRTALGASRLAIVRLIVRDAVTIVSAGSIVGAALSFVLTRAIWPLLAGQQGVGMTPAAILVVFALTLTVGVAAVLRPALIAATADPARALRQD